MWNPLDRVVYNVAIFQLDPSAHEYSLARKNGSQSGDTLFPLKSFASGHQVPIL
jgi:hypothetical protein